MGWVGLDMSSLRDLLQQCERNVQSATGSSLAHTHNTHRANKGTERRWSKDKPAEVSPASLQGSLVPWSLGRKFPLLAKRFATAAGSFAESSLAAEGRPGGQATSHLNLTWPGLGNLAIFDPILHTSALTPFPLPLLCLIRDPSPHAFNHVQARPQSSCGFGLCRAQGKSAPFLSPAPKTSRALKPRCPRQID